MRIPHPQTGGLADPLNQALSLFLTEGLDPKTKKAPKIKPFNTARNDVVL
jgi:hypothetical protein